MLLISSYGLLGQFPPVSWARKLPFKVTSLTFQILFINYKTQHPMSTIHLKKKDSSIKRLQKGSQIDTLYHQFQSLKSQIYGVKREPKSKGMQSQWSSKGNKEKAVDKLRESTIQKCQQEFQENLSLIHSQHKFKKSLFKKGSQVPEVGLNDDRVVELGESPIQSQSYSRKYREYDESPSINLQESAKVSIAQENLCFTQGEQLFRDFLNRIQRPIFPELSASRRSQPDHSQSVSIIKDILTNIAEDHLKKLNFLFETLTFMSRKLHCLEMIIQEYGKILKTKFQSLKRNQEQQVIINVESLENKYATEMQKLTQFYQQQLRKQSSKRSIEQPRTFEDSNFAESLKVENARLEELLKQARCLIQTKEELITALTQENQELREEVEKWKRPNLIRGSAESSLGYSATADKHPKRDGSSHQMELIAERLNLALGKGRQDKRGWDDFQEGQDDINYSELQSVRDKSMDQWDISHLQMRQTSNAKSLEQDCLKVMRNKQGEASQQDI